MKETNKSKYPIKTYPTLGCCGLDCGLCPRYYTVGSSRCPGCLGPDFFNKHPSCSFITCCVKKKNLEVCAECAEFPCSKFDGFDAADSFLTHRKAIPNLDLIRKYGLEAFIKQQKKRIELLEEMLNEFDEGRSKSYYCIAATVMEIDELKKALAKARKDSTGLDIKGKAKLLHSKLDEIAEQKVYFLRLRK